MRDERGTTGQTCPRGPTWPAWNAPECPIAPSNVTQRAGKNEASRGSGRGVPPPPAADAARGAACRAAQFLVTVPLSKSIVIDWSSAVTS
jgi:hypothetical protein